ncbi:MAG: NUDIX hydrolase [Kiritimatiellae bacterium]|jgi:ADP-ribose pyrophosphatase|nr:NUDIX hydrolase [Kiritimatiellia bacterium]
MEKTLTRKRVFEGKLLKIDLLDVELDNGDTSKREIICHPGAAVIWAKLPDDRFVLVKQYRKAVEDYFIEAIAGTLDPNETPDVCAQRELQEETGYTAKSMTKLGVIAPAPGYTEELFHTYYAELNPVQGNMNLDDDENIEVVYYTAEQLEKMIKSGEICDAKTIVAWHLYLQLAE